MYYLPLDPYHRNLSAHWRSHRDIHLNYDFHSWVEKNYRARVHHQHAIENNYWQFEHEQDMVAFAMRWG